MRIEAKEAVTLYHGSDEPNISVFEGSTAGRRGYFGAGLYTTPHFDEAAFYGRYIYEGTFSGSLFTEIYSTDDANAVGDLGDVQPCTFRLGDDVYSTQWDESMQGEVTRVTNMNAYRAALAAAIPAEVLSVLGEINDYRAPDQYDVEEVRQPLRRQ